jgi:hypothetical protein
MLTDTSGINSLSGYQVQPNVSNSNRSASSLETVSSVKFKESGDTVDISSKAKELQTEYQRKNSELEQRKNSETQQLERKYLLEKNELEREFRLKKQRLDINVYA